MRQRRVMNYVSNDDFNTAHYGPRPEAKERQMPDDKKFRIDYSNGFEIVTHKDIFEAMRVAQRRCKQMPMSTRVPIKIEQLEPKPEPYVIKLGRD